MPIYWKGIFWIEENVIDTLMDVIRAIEEYVSK